MNKLELYKIRDVEPGDFNFIMATFLRGVYYGNSLFNLIKKDVFMANYHAVIERILARPTTSIRVACLKDDPGIILGYAILKGNTLDWCFVKSAWRNIGVAKELVPPTVTTATHLTKLGESILKKKGMEFNPFDL